MKLLLFILFNCSAIPLVIAQTNINIQNNHGDIVRKKTVLNYYKSKNKEPILLIHKYIDTSKNILILAGTNIISITYNKLKEIGIFPLETVISSPSLWHILWLKLVGHKLIVSSDINGIDGKYIARVRDNKLITSKSYHIFTSSKSFEVYDDYYIPVLQIELVKEKNAIYIGGVFNSNYGYVIISKRHGLQNVPFNKPYLLMPEQQKDSILHEYLNNVKVVEPIHDTP